MRVTVKGGVWRNAEVRFPLQAFALANAISIPLADAAALQHASAAVAR